MPRTQHALYARGVLDLIVCSLVYFSVYICFSMWIRYEQDAISLNGLCKIELFNVIFSEGRLVGYLSVAENRILIDIITSGVRLPHC